MPNHVLGDRLALCMPIIGKRIIPPIAFLMIVEETKPLSPCGIMWDKGFYFFGCKYAVGLHNKQALYSIWIGTMLFYCNVF